MTTSTYTTQTPDVVLDETFLALPSGLRSVTDPVPCEFDGLGANCYLPTDYEFLAVDAHSAHGYVDEEQRVQGEVTGVTPQRYGGRDVVRVHTEPYGEVAPFTEAAILHHE